MKACHVAAKFDLKIDVLQPMYNLVKRQAEVEIIPACADQDVAVVPYSPLGGGLLTGKYAAGDGGRLKDVEMYTKRYDVEWMHAAAAALPKPALSGRDGIHHDRRALRRDGRADADTAACHGPPRRGVSDVVIIGGGIAGLSAAAALAPLGRVVVLEAEAALGMHATGRSAAIFLRDYGNEIAGMPGLQHGADHACRGAAEIPDPEPGHRGLCGLPRGCV